jgi:hypothetical protein
MNDPDFSGELPFHDDHLDGKDGKPGIFHAVSRGPCHRLGRTS